MDISYCTTALGCGTLMVGPSILGGEIRYTALSLRLVYAMSTALEVNYDEEAYEEQKKRLLEESRIRSLPQPLPYKADLCDCDVCQCWPANRSRKECRDYLRRMTEQERQDLYDDI